MQPARFPVPPLTAWVSALPSRRLHLFASIMRILLWLTLAAWLLLALALGLLHGWIVPRIDDFRPALERRASAAIGVPVRIGAVSAYANGVFPSFELREVTLQGSSGETALRLPRLQASVSATSLWRLGFDQLLLEQPELAVRRSADGKLYVGGVLLSQGKARGPGDVADWLFSQPELLIRSGTVRWTDELAGTAPLVLTDVDWTLRNSARRHALRLDATPPPEWGARINLRGNFSRPLLSLRSGDVDQWSGQLYAESDRAELPVALPYIAALQRPAGKLPDQPGWRFDGGRGALRAWLDVARGRVVAGEVDVALEGLTLQIGPGLQPLAFANVSARLKGARRAGGFDAATENLKFQLADGLVWTGGNLAVTHSDASAAAPEQSSLTADQLDLAAIRHIASRLPLPVRSQALIESLAPAGLVETLKARWTGPLAAPVSYTASGRVSGLRLASAPSWALPGTELPAAPAPAGKPAPAAALTPATLASPGRPGIEAATIDFDLTQGGGKASISIAGGALDFPGVFDEARVPFERLTTDATWKHLAPSAAAKRLDTAAQSQSLPVERGFELQLRNLRFANADGEGQASLNWQRAAPITGSSREAAHAHELGVIDLTGSLNRVNGARVHRYLPLVLPEPARHYVREAVVAGHASDVKFKVKGNVADIPFANPQRGELRVSASVRQGQLAYVPAYLQPAGALPWPALTDLSGELLIANASLKVSRASGKVTSLPGLQLLRADAVIPDMLRAATVELQTEVRGPLAEALAFVNTSPLAGITNKSLVKTVASGVADYRFKFSLPINDIDKSRVEGSVTLPGNDVLFWPGTPTLADLKGAIAITERGFTVTGAEARVLGGELRFDGGLRADAAPGSAEAAVFFKGQGQITADALRQLNDLPWVPRLAQHASGSTGYSATLGFRQGQAEVTVASSLRGLALNLPAPLGKPADADLPMKFDNTLVAESPTAGRPLQDRLEFSLGNVAQLRYLRDLSGAQPRVLRGMITFGAGAGTGEAAPVPERGVTAFVNLPRLDVDAWQALAGGAAPTTAPAAVGTAAGADAASDLQPYLPTALSLRTGELKLQGRQLTSVVASGTREAAVWRVNVEASELAGNVEYREPGGAGGARVLARLSRLRLAPGAAAEVENLLAPKPQQPADIPALDIVVDDFELRGKKLGRVEIEAVNRSASAAGGGREWRLNKLKVTLPEAVFNATGNWALAPLATTAAATAATAATAAADRRRTAMVFTLDIADSGELLKRFGMDGVVRRGKGKLEGQIDWAGSPLDLDVPTLSGQFNVNVEAGQFVKADPGIAKLLGVLSLQSLPRRLTLDFRDVFSEGFAFDFVRGDVTIARGTAQTNNLQMRGLTAAVLMDGSADIARETQDLRVIVVPEINAGTASLIATVINPAVGLGTFLAQLFLRRPLMEAATQEFHIDGSWADPKITRVERRARSSEQRSGEAAPADAKQ